ncbi:MAG: hypothetical protein ISS48_00665 [Candidatus Aenigmarchaeota archaeon]|nr:hypothetical protein [Candidatus Aenigmarchaeota archaeon]
MNNYCAYCGKELEELPFKCRYCGEYFCVDHQLPENHACSGLEDWKAGKLKKFKKEVKISRKSTKSKLLEIHRKNKWVEFLLVIGGVIILVLVLRMLV